MHPPNLHPLDLTEWYRREPITGDASARRYSRLSKRDGQTAILVEYPDPAHCRLGVDLEVLSWCHRRGLRVPELLASDTATGRALLEDFGKIDAEGALAAAPGKRRYVLLERMIGPLEILAMCRPEDLPSWNPPLDRTRLRWELAGFELWFVRHYRSLQPSRRLAVWLDELADRVGAHPRRVCHRDYHLNNILIQEDGSVGIIDVQDILVGPDTYDAVSLTAERTAARLLSTSERRSALSEWAGRTSAESGWRERAVEVQIQRGLKVLGTFARFTVTGRTEYRRWLTELAGDLGSFITAAGAPPEVTSFLLD